MNPEKQIQCAERVVNIISTYPIILEWKFSYIYIYIKTQLKTARKTINKPFVNRKSLTFHL